MNVVHNFRQGRQLQIPERVESEHTKTWKQVLIDVSIATILSVTHPNDESDHLFMKPEGVPLSFPITTRGEITGNDLDTA